MAEVWTDDRWIHSSHYLLLAFSTKLDAKRMGVESMKFGPANVEATSRTCLANRLHEHHADHGRENAS